MQVIINMEFIIVNATSADSSDMAEGCKSCYTQVICVKTILSSALLAIGYRISHLFHKSPPKKSIYTGVSFQLKQGFFSVYNSKVKRTGGNDEQ